MAAFAALGFAVDVNVAAVAEGPATRTAELVLGRARSDGTANTWRHALAGSSHYRDADEATDAAALERVPCSTVPLLGEAGILSDDVTYVKLDIEGAELDLLRKYKRGAWRNVSRLIVEYSFTKDRRMDHFREICAKLEQEGFVVMFEGKTSWERLEQWPWHMDALIFAARTL